MIYIDTSILAAYYCPEPLSREAERVVRSRPLPAISDLTEVELLSAISLKVRMGELEATEAQKIATKFSTHLDENLYRRLPLERRHYVLARDWIGRFQTPLRTLDALHLAVAVSEELRLVTADEGLTNSGQVMGIDVQLIGAESPR